MGRVIGIALKTRTRGPMRTIERLLLHKNIGLDGRVTSEPGFRQVTLLDSAKWKQVQAELGVELPWYERRANLLTEGIDLMDTIGRRIMIGSALVEILDELEPCARMHDVHPKLYEALNPDLRGGVFGRILVSGRVRNGDAITFAPADVEPAR